MARRPASWGLLLLALGLGAGRAGAAELVDFARCITRAGATYYTAEWCPHCARQNAMFGNAIRYLRIVDCTRGCAGVGSFPTWRFADGSQQSGVASLDLLARRTRCRLGEQRKDEPAGAGVTDAAATRARERYLGGARIIEVPGR